MTYGADRRSWRIVFRFTDRAAERRCERRRKGGGKAARGLISTESGVRDSDPAALSPCHNAANPAPKPADLS